MSNYLGTINSDIEPYTINAFDIETTGKENEFLMGSIVGHRTLNGEPEVYWDKKEMLKALLSRRFREGYMYATNLEFDLMGILEPDFLEQKGFDMEIFHNGANIIHAKFRKHGNTWEFRDTFNIAPHFSVSAMGDIIDLPKLDEELGINFEVNDATDYDRDVMQRYNVRDSRITFEFMKWFQNQLNELGGNLQVTAAKTSMKYFRRNFLDSEYAIEQPSEDIIRASYRGYYGGRVSPIVKGHIDGPVYNFDIASLYPYCMREQDFPDTNTIRYEADNDKSDFELKRERILNNEGMSCVTIEAPDEIDIPVLPYKTEDKLAFPKGELRDVMLCHNELRFALERGYTLTDIGEQIYTLKSFNPFEGFVNSMFNKRLEYKSEGNPTEAIVKLLMNSLYGKFGQKLENDDGGIYEPIQQKSFDELVGKRVKGGWVISPVDDETGQIPAYINPLIASYVTARGRMELYEWFETAQDKGGEVYYCDTDSIYTNVDLNPKDEKILGKMDYERKLEDLWVFGPKMYVAKPEGKDEFKYTMKGVPTGQMDKMWNAIRNKRNQIEYEKISGMREAIKQGVKPNEMINRTRTTEVNQATKRKHDTTVDMINNRVDTEPVSIAYDENGEGEVCFE